MPVTEAVQQCGEQSLGLVRLADRIGKDRADLCLIDRP